MGYLRFLQLIAESPRMELVAPTDVDLVWHEHILDTKNYAVDCNNLFGRLLHHRRARSAADVAEIPLGYERSKRAYAIRFGKEPPAQYWGETTQSASMCGGGGLNGDSDMVEGGAANPTPGSSPSPPPGDGQA